MHVNFLNFLTCLSGRNKFVLLMLKIWTDSAMFCIYHSQVPLNDFYESYYMLGMCRNIINLLEHVGRILSLIFIQQLLYLYATNVTSQKRDGRKSLVLKFFLQRMEEHHTKSNPRMVKTISLGMPKAPHWTY
jgi:hypothetical protein